jgi:hypothetical protein
LPSGRLKLMLVPMGSSTLISERLIAFCPQCVPEAIARSARPNRFRPQARFRATKKPPQGLFPKSHAP